LRKPTKVESEGQPVPAEKPNVDAERHACPLALDEIRSQGRLFRLNRPLQIKMTNFGSGWCYESKLLAILAFGRSKQEVLDSFMEDFSVLWDAIAQAPDESLTIDAIAVKHAFQQLVRAVTAE